MVEQPRVIEQLVKTDGVEQPVTWEDLSKLERLNHISLNVYTLHKEENRYHFSVSRKENEKYSTVIPLLILDEKHMMLIKDVESYYRKLTRTPPSRSNDTKFCKICFCSVPATIDMSAHECRCSFPQTLLLANEDQKVKFKNYGNAYSPSHLYFFDF